MNSNQISTPIAIAIAAVALIVTLGLGYKFFLAPASGPPQPNAAALYPGGHSAGTPAPATP